MPYVISMGSPMWTLNANDLFWFVFGIIRFKISLWCSCHIGLSADVSYMGDAIFTAISEEHMRIPKKKLGTKVFWEHFFREKTWKMHFHCVHTFMFVCITTHLFRFTCIHYLHTNAMLHAISSCICELSSPACINKQGEEETVRTSWKTWLYFPWHHSSGINSVNVSLSFFSSPVQGLTHMATARHNAVLQGFHVAWCQNLCFAFPPRANLSHPFLTQSSLGLQVFLGMDPCTPVW